LENGSLIATLHETFEVVGPEEDFTRFYFPVPTDGITLSSNSNYLFDFSIEHSQSTAGHFLTVSNLELFGNLTAVPEPHSYALAILGSLAILGLVKLRRGRSSDC